MSLANTNLTACAWGSLAHKAVHRSATGSGGLSNVPQVSPEDRDGVCFHHDLIPVGNMNADWNDEQERAVTIAPCVTIPPHDTG